MLLENKNGVVYGAGGAIDGAVTRLHPGGMRRLDSLSEKRARRSPQYRLYLRSRFESLCSSSLAGPR